MWFYECKLTSALAWVLDKLLFYWGWVGYLVNFISRAARAWVTNRPENGLRNSGSYKSAGELTLL